MPTPQDLKAGAAGIADQALLSGVNLVIGLLLARQLEPAAFGVYVVAFAVLLIGYSFQLSLITDPLLILGAPRTGREQSLYFGTLLRLQLLLSLAVALVLALVAGAMRAAWGGDSLLPAALAGVALAAIPVQAQIFFRALLFARLRPSAVLWNDAIYSFLRVGSLITLVQIEKLSVLSVLITMGASAGLAAVIAAAMCRDVLSARTARVIRTWNEHWDYGRWLLATSVAFWCSGQAPALLAASLLSPVAAAVIRACQYLATPLNVALTGLDGILAPRASRIRAANGDAGLRRFLRFFAFGAGVCVAVYAVILLPFVSSLMQFIYKGQYSGYSTIVSIFLLDALLAAISRAPIIRLKAHGDTRRVFYGYVWAAGAGLSSLLLLAPSYGVHGAAAAAPIASLALLCYLTVGSRSPRSAASESLLVSER